jgi:hypothetical protein
MSFGIVELITLLLGASGFGLSNNPKPATPDQALQYAIPNADVVGFFDVASVVPGNYKLLTQLADQPQIKASPELAKAVRQALGEVEAARGLAKTTIGIDPATDIDDVSAFFQFVPKHDPNIVLTVHGRFKTELIDKIATMTHQASAKAGGGTFVETGEGNGVGLTKDGVLIAGTLTLVKDRVADTWKAPPHAAGSNLGYAADMLVGNPVFAVSLTPSPVAKSALLENDKDRNYGTDLIKRGKMLSLALYHDGLGWSWVDSSKAGLDSMAQVSDGLVDLFRAAQLAPRGFAKMALGALDSYRGVDKQVDELIRHKADLMKIVDAYVGDGSFKAQVDKDVKALRLHARLTGKSLSDVVPFGGMVPLAAVGMLTWREKAMPSEVAAPPPALAPIPAGTTSAKHK